MSVSMRYGSSGYSTTNGLRLDLLWTNDDPTSNFAAQTVTLDLTGYTHYMVVPIFSTSNQNLCPPVVSPVEDGLVLSLLCGSGSNNRVGARTCYYDSSVPGVEFAGGSYNGASNNAYVIPFHIYGIRSSGGVTVAGWSSGGGGGGGVTSVNGKTGVVLLTASDVGAVPTSQGIPSGGNATQVLAKKTNTDYDMEWVNQSGGGGAVDSVNGQTGTVVLDADDVGALPDSTAYVASFNGNTGAVTYTAPVSSVNGQTGAVSLSIPSTASDVGAIAAPSSPATGAFLVWSGSAWVAQTLAQWSGGNY